MTNPMNRDDTPNREDVICPNCSHQFRAIPEQVQSLLLASGHKPPFLTSPPATQPDAVAGLVEKWLG